LQPGGPAAKFYFQPTALNAQDLRQQCNQDAQRKSQKFLDDLARPVEGLRRGIANLLQADTYNLLGMYHQSDFIVHAERLASFCEPIIEQLEEELQVLKNNQRLRPELIATPDPLQMPKGFGSAHFDRLLGRLEEQLLRPARHISGVVEYPEDDFVGHLGSAVVTAPFFSRFGLPRTEQHPPIFSTNISYYRVTRNLC
jgi:hypothetical protein